MRNGALVLIFRTSIADIGCLIDAVTVLPFKTAAGLIAFDAGTAAALADDDLVTDILLFAMITMDKKVVGIVERAFMKGIRNTITFYFF